MKFSKTTLFAAALLAGSAAVPVSAVSADALFGNVVINEDNYEIDLGGKTTTLNGAFVSSDGSFADKGVNSDTGFKNEKNTETVTITGGGSLTYVGGVGMGAGYYTGSYSMTRGDIDLEENSNIWSAWESLDSFWSAPVFSGTVVVDAGTTLNLQGQLTQYVEFFKPTLPTASSPAASVFGGYAGVSALELRENATLSFENSTLNVMSSRLNLGSLNPSDNYNPEGIFALNFLNNLKSDSSSRIVIGTDTGSVNRILLNVDAGEISTVGRLVGNGRFYTAGNGTVSFIGESELNPGSRMDAGGNADVSGNTWLAGNRLADIVLGSSIVNVGSADGGATTVDNVFKNATAVHLVSSLDNAASNTITFGSSGDTVNGAAEYFGGFSTQAGRDETGGLNTSLALVNVYGEQVFNNFQSLWHERSALLPDASDPFPLPSASYYEPVKFSWRTVGGALLDSTGLGTRVSVQQGAVLTINQSKGRDGYYAGVLDTTRGGLVVKTGEGRILYNHTTIYSGTTSQFYPPRLSNLRIEGGEWIWAAIGNLSASAGTMNVTVTSNGSLRLIIADSMTANFVVTATDSTSTLRLARSYTLENDLTTESLEAVHSASGNLDLDALDYRETTVYSSAGTARIQILAQQVLFRGVVSVEDSVTLTLGGGASSDSVFSSASAILLDGEGSGESANQWRYSTLEVYGTQLVRNLSGDADKSAVKINNGSSLVLTNTGGDYTYSGGISGMGNLVKLGSSQQRIFGNENGELTGAAVVLAGSVALDQTNANAGPSALILKGATSASFSGNSKVGALIGDAETTISISGDLTVGSMRNPTGATDGSYFATADYGEYNGYFADSSARTVLSALKSAAESARSYQTGTGSSAVISTVSLGDTKTYLANPAKLVYTTDAGVYDGAFAKVFATTGTDAHGTNVFEKMMRGDAVGFFAEAEDVSSWLRLAFTEKRVHEFLQTSGAQLSEEMKANLEELAAKISGSNAGVLEYLDGSGNLNALGWNKIVAAGGLDMLKWQMRDLVGEDGTSPLAQMQDDSLYSFITAFYGENDTYEFILTQSNAQQIEQIYGVGGSAWFTGTLPNYEEFAKSFGVSAGDGEPAFAGMLGGMGSLIKRGAETLRLTGQNSYTGATKVEQGELRVNWNSIQHTSGISVERGALLTIDADRDSIDLSHRDPENEDNYLSGYDADSYGEFFSGSLAEDARISGAGVLLKIGDGNVDLGNALLDVADGNRDFTGTIIVGEGALRATVDPVARAVSENGLDFDLHLSGEDVSFDLVFARTANYDFIFGEKPAELKFGKTVSGNATFVLDAGVTKRKADENEYETVGNNVLTVAAEKFSAGAVVIRSGALRFEVNNGGEQALFKNAKLGEDTELVFELYADSAELGGDVNILPLSVKGEDGETKDTYGALVVSTEMDPVSEEYPSRTLTLNGTGLSGIRDLQVLGGARLEILGTADAPDVVLNSLATASKTTLTIGAGRTVELKDGSGTIAGTLAGEGKLVFDGAEDEKLTIGSAGAASAETAFSGEIEFSGGTIELVSGKGKTVSYVGMSISGDSVSEKTLVKNGAGTVEILRDDGKGNTISVSGLTLSVNEGELAVSGVVLQEADTAPEKLEIADGATLRLRDGFSSGEIDFDDLGKSLTGRGVLAFTSESALNVNVESFDASAFSGVVELTNEDTKLTLGEDVKEFAAFSGKGTVEVLADSLRIRADANGDGAEGYFEGNLLGGNLTELTVVGDGALVFKDADSVPENIEKITIGSAEQNGGIGVGVRWGKEIVATGETSRVLISGYDEDGAPAKFAGTVSVGESVRNLVLLRDGTLSLGENAVAASFNLSGAGAVETMTLGNIANKTLVLTNLDKIAAEDFELQTNAGKNGGGIIFSGNGSASEGTLAQIAVSAEDAAPEPPAVVWDKDISGRGGIAVAGGAALTLTADALSYTGKTVVEAGSKLVYGTAGMTSATSELRVEGTLEGGADLVAEGSTVSFANGAEFVFTGSAIRFTGTASIDELSLGENDGSLNVVIDADASGVRGVPVSLLEYIGAEDSYGKLTFDWENVNVVHPDEENTLLYYIDATNDAKESGKLVFYVATDDLASSVDLHEGLGSSFIEMLSEIATPDSDGRLNNRNALGITLIDDEGRLTAAGALAETIIKTPNGSLAGTLNNLSPLSYGAMLALPQSGFLSDISAISARIEQRRYDNYSQFIWETHNDWEFFVQAQGTFVESDDGETDTRTFDMNTYGAIAGADVKMNATTVAGFSVAYDYGEADIHDGGGDIKSNDFRATAFLGKLFAERFYLDTGVQAGFATFDVKRHTALGSVDGDADGWHAGAFANLGVLLPLWVSDEDDKTNLCLMPYVGLAYSYYSVGSFDESGAATALDTDSFDASSLRASIGASLALTFPWSGKTTRLNLDVAYSRELLDTEADIDSSMPGIFGGERMKFESTAFAQDVFSVGPRISVEIGRDKSIYAGYRFDFSTDSDMSHSVNIGFRSRF